MSTPSSSRTQPPSSALVRTSSTHGSELIPVLKKDGSIVRSLDKQFVLEEEEYTEAISTIIARDFFPSLARLEATNAYLDAVESMDEDRLESSVRRLVEVDQGMTPLPRDEGGSTPFGVHQTASTPLWTSQTPSQTPYRTPVPSSSHRFLAGPVPARPSSLPTLDTFQTHFTSEDNASFGSILQEENVKRKGKYAWAYEAEDKVWARLEEGKERWVRRLGDASGSGQQRAIKSIGPADSGAVRLIEGGPRVDKGKGKEVVRLEESALQVAVVSEGERPTDIPLEEGSYLAKALLDAGLPATAVDDQAVVLREARGKLKREKEEREKRDPGGAGWPFKTRNPLMYAPDADVSPYAQPNDPIVRSNQLPKEIVHSNTWFPGGLENEIEGSFGKGGEPPSPTRSRIAAAIDGTPYPEGSSSIPIVNGYPLVPNEPSPTPSSLGPERIKQLLTWGTLLSTPRAINSSESTPFRIKDPSRRDDLGRRLASNASKAIADRSKGRVPSSEGYKPLNGSGAGRKRGLGEMNPPTWTARLGSVKRPGSGVELSPAGRGLLARTRMGSLTPRSSAGWAPTGGRKEGRDLSTMGWDASPRG